MVSLPWPRVAPTGQEWSSSPVNGCASKEAELAQEIRVTFFEHLLLYTNSVAYGHWASTTSATALGVHSPASLLSSPSPPEGCPQTRCITTVFKE